MNWADKLSDSNPLKIEILKQVKANEIVAKISDLATKNKMSSTDEPSEEMAALLQDLEELKSASEKIASTGIFLWKGTGYTQSMRFTPLGTVVPWLNSTWRNRISSFKCASRYGIVTLCDGNFFTGTRISFAYFDDPDLYVGKKVWGIPNLRPFHVNFDDRTNSYF